MNALKKLPIAYTGSLHDIRIVNFFVDMDEVKNNVPEQIRIRSFNGRAMISLVNVMLRDMRPQFFPQAMHFDYRHIAFRLLVDDAALNKGTAKGLYFLQSFTDSVFATNAGNLFTDYRLEHAQVHAIDNMLELQQGDKFLNYALDFHDEPVFREQLQLTGQLDRAYSVMADELRMTKICRTQWPLKPTGCYLFETNFFKTAELAAAFRITDKIDYQWMPPQTIARCA